LYSSVSFGAGGAVGSLASGYLWQGIGPGLTFAAAAVAALVGALAAWHWIDQDHDY
jgi:PPP family 3-phenylpropionic acid transporter